ncbi:MAG TPA: hypothetical protein VF627_04350 [Abditibacterium sp.]|jgi:hypothetical protein
MKTEAQQIKIILIYAFCICSASFAFIRMMALFRCAWQKQAAGEPLDVLAKGYGAFTHLAGFPLSFLSAPTVAPDASLPFLFCGGVVLNSVFLGLIAAGLMIGLIALSAASALKPKHQ